VLQGPVSDELAALIAGRFRLLADPTRIRLLDRLRDGEASVQELTAAVGSTQQNVSKHLGLLAAGGVVARRRDGSYARYRVVDEGVYDLCAHVCGSAERHLAGLAATLRVA
jgi:DNA-binding transcriptional ArsR family regulator